MKKHSKVYVVTRKVFDRVMGFRILDASGIEVIGVFSDPDFALDFVKQVASNTEFHNPKKRTYQLLRGEPLKRLVFTYKQEQERLYPFFSYECVLEQVLSKD